MGTQSFYRFLFFSFLLLFSCQSKKVEKKKRAPSVTAMKVEEKTLPADLVYIGVAKSSHIVELRARVEGYLEQILYEEGSMVEKGDLMFVLDQRPFIDEVERAKGEVERKRATLWNAVQTKKRMVPLYKQNAVSQKDLDEALSSEYAAEASLATAKAQLEKAKLNLSYASIESPVSGMAGRAIFREGALISPGEDSLLTNIYVIDPIWVNYTVSSGDILKAKREVSQGLLRYPKDMNFAIYIRLSDGTLLPAKGKIDFTDPAFDQSTGTILVRSVLANPNRNLLPGQFVEVIVKGMERPDAIAIPQTAIQQGENGIFCYTIEEGKAKIRPLKVGDWIGEYWIVLNGLEKGEVVITQGVNKVENNMPVQISRWASFDPLQKKNKI